MAAITVGRVLSYLTDSIRTVSQAGTAARTSVAASVSDTLLVAANASRQALIIYNQSDSPLYVGYGVSAVSTSSFTLIVSANAEKELPGGFTGQIRGIWTVATGNARITEIS